jgi:hypothetical protein|nr:MAG TPA: hypothetical protein [Caudoviricetes sp.]
MRIYNFLLFFYYFFYLYLLVCWQNRNKYKKNKRKKFASNFASNFFCWLLAEENPLKSTPVFCCLFFNQVRVFTIEDILAFFVRVFCLFFKQIGKIIKFLLAQLPSKILLAERICKRYRKNPDFSGKC